MTTPLRSGQPFLITLGAMLSLLPATRAQVPFDISPFASLYAPLGNMFVAGNCGGSPCGYPNGGSAAPLGQTVALQKTIALGGHLTTWPTGRRWGIEATFAYAPSGVTMACRMGGCNGGHAVTASARVVVPVIGATSARSFYLGAGVGLVGLGGIAYAGVTGTTSISPTVGAGLELKVASARSVRIEAEDYMFRPPFRLASCDASWGVCRVLPPNNWPQQFQHTVILSVGWVFRDGGSRNTTAEARDTTTAQQTRPSYSLRAGLTVPTGSFHSNANGDGYNAGWQGMALVEFKLPRTAFGVRLDGSYGENSGNDKLQADNSVNTHTPSDIKAKILGANADLTFAFNSSSRAKAYVLAGVGMYNFRTVANYITASSLSSKMSFAWNGGAGLSYSIGGVSLVLEARYFNISSPPFQASDIRYIPIFLGVRFGAG